MIEKIKITFELIVKGELKCKLTKCQFMKNEVEILGWIIGNGRENNTKTKKSY